MLAERLGTLLGLGAVLLFLAVTNLICAWLVRRPRRIAPRRLRCVESAPARSGLRVLAEAPYLRNLAALTLIVTTGAGLADFVFKATIYRGGRARREPSSFLCPLLCDDRPRHVRGAGLVEPVHARTVRAGRRCGHALNRAGDRRRRGLLMPGLRACWRCGRARRSAAVRCIRAGYELFFTPIPPAEKRAVKSVIDVGFDRLGDAVAGGILRLVLLGVAPAARSP